MTISAAARKTSASPSAEPEQLRVAREPVERVDDDEGERAASAASSEQGDREQLGAGSRRRAAATIRSRSPGPRRVPRLRREQEQRPRDDQRVLEPYATAAASSRSRCRPPTSDDAARNQVTSPSGTGPTWPIAQPPRSSGCFAYST